MSRTYTIVSNSMDRSLASGLITKQVGEREAAAHMVMELKHRWELVCAAQARLDGYTFCVSHPDGMFDRKVGEHGMWFKSDGSGYTDAGARLIIRDESGELVLDVEFGKVRRKGEAWSKWGQSIIEEALAIVHGIVDAKGRVGQ